MQKRLKKTVSIFLAFVMAFSLLAIPVYAQSDVDSVGAGVDESFDSALSFFERILKFFEELYIAITNFLYGDSCTKPTPPPEPDVPWPDDAVPVDPVEDNLADVIAELAALPEGGAVLLEEGEYHVDEQLKIPAGVSIYGTPDSAIVLDFSSYDGGSTSGGSSDSKKPIISIEGDGVTVNGVTVDCDDIYAKGIVVNGAYEDIVIENNVIIDCGNDAIDISKAISPVVTGNHIEGAYDNGIRIGGAVGTPEEPVIISNNTIANGSTTNGAIWIEGGSGDMIISNNEISDVYSVPGSGSSAIKGAAIHIYTFYNSGLITIENNKINNCEFAISVYKYTAKSVDDKILIKDNTITNCTYDIVTSMLGTNNYANITTVVEITNSGAEERLLLHDPSWGLAHKDALVTFDGKVVVHVSAA